MSALPSESGHWVIEDGIGCFPGIVIGNLCGDSRVAIFLEKQKKRERETPVNAEARHSKIDLQPIQIIFVFGEQICIYIPIVPRIPRIPALLRTVKKPCRDVVSVPAHSLQIVTRRARKFATEPVAREGDRTRASDQRDVDADHIWKHPEEARQRSRGWHPLHDVSARLQPTPGQLKEFDRIELSGQGCPRMDRISLDDVV